MKATLYHNPRCAKSRAALQLLRERGIEPTVIEYLQHPPSAAELARILTLLKMEPRELMRKKESEYKSAGLAAPGLTRAQLIEAMVRHPILIERPLLVIGNRAALGRPPENILSVLER